MVEKNQDEMSRVIARSGLARHFGNIALISDDAVILLLSNLYTESVQKGWREPNHISFALWTLFGGRESHPPKSVGASQKRMASKLARLECHKPG